MVLVHTQRVGSDDLAVAAFLLDYVEMFPCNLMMSGAISWFLSIVFSSS